MTNNEKINELCRYYNMINSSWFEEAVIIKG